MESSLSMIVARFNDTPCSNLFKINLKETTIMPQLIVPALQGHNIINILYSFTVSNW